MLYHFAQRTFIKDRCPIFFWFSRPFMESMHVLINLFKIFNFIYFFILIFYTEHGKFICVYVYM